jgi:hypothetical protein
LRHSNIISSVLMLTLVLVALFLASCNGAASIGWSTQQPLFAPAPGFPLPIAGGPGNVSIGDMNNDGTPDLVVALGEARRVTVLLGQGDSQFRTTTGQAISMADSPGEMALGDVNGDGNLDLAVATHDSYGVTLLLGDGKGALVLAPNSPVVMREGQHPHTHGLGLGDLNSDGKLDLATVNNEDNDVSVAFGDGRGVFSVAPGSPFAVGPSPYPLALGDANNDGHLDIVATTSATGPARAQQLASSRALTLLLADGHGGFLTKQIPLRTGEPWFAAIGDLNGDGKADLLATHHDRSELTILLGEGSGRFTETRGSPLDLGHNAFHFALADVNRDGRTDVVLTVGNGIRLMIGDGRGNFRQAPGSPFLTGRGTWRLALGDLNKDGRLDVATSNVESNSVSVLLGR